MIGRLLHFCRGYVRLEVRGASLERFVDLCRTNGIEVWAVERQAIDCMTLCMEAGDWAWIEPLCSRTCCTASVLWCEGLKKRMRPMAKRHSLWMTAGICMALCLLSGQFLWTIRIEGCETISQREIYDQLRGCGLETGRLKQAIDCRTIRGDMMTLREDLSYLTINIRGTEALVTVTEKHPEKKKEALPVPCDLYADRAGVIYKMQVRNGEEVAKVGDTVIPGDLLVRGQQTSTQGEVRLEAADADVLLKTWPEVRMAMSDEVYGYTETGDVQTRWSIVVGNRRVALPCIEKIGDACYYKTMETTAVSLGEGYFFPLTLVRETWHLCTAQRLELSEAACGEVLHAACLRLLAQRCLPGSVEEIGFASDFGPDGIHAVLQAEALEQTGRKIPLLGENQ